MGHLGRRGRDEKVEALARQAWAAGPDDQRWLAASSDEVHAGAGSVVARRARPARWIYVVVAGEVRVGDVLVGPGRCLTPADGDLVAASDAFLLAVPARLEAEVRNRFPALDATPNPPPATPATPVCPVHAAVARALRREPAFTAR